MTIKTNGTFPRKSDIRKWILIFLLALSVAYLVAVCVVYQMIGNTNSDNESSSFNDRSNMFFFRFTKEHPTLLLRQNRRRPKRLAFDLNDSTLNYPGPRVTSQRYLYEQGKRKLQQEQLYQKAQAEQHFQLTSKMIQQEENLRVQSVVEQMRLANDLTTVDTTLNYNIHKCPKQIPKGYPKSWNIVTVLTHWNPDDMTIPQSIYQGLCSLDWNDPEQRQTADVYRKAEVPFLIQNHPEVWKASDRWSNATYLSTLLGATELYRNEYAHENNHLMYWKLHDFPAPYGWKPPSENVDLTFDEWYQHAMELEQETEASKIAHSDHWYFRLNAIWNHPTDFLYDELPFFRPIKSFFMVDPEDYRGLNCRLGMKGTIAETHYDSSRNFILLLHGQKRYILAHPKECRNMELYPLGHPSARHSSLNWSNPDDYHFGNFPHAQVNEVVLQAGDILYLPTYWFHFIVSLNLNYQCNSRCGITMENIHHMEECGF